MPVSYRFRSAVFVKLIKDFETKMSTFQEFNYKILWDHGDPYRDPYCASILNLLFCCFGTGGWFVHQRE